jgi:hypothetical protein
MLPRFQARRDVRRDRLAHGRDARTLGAFCTMSALLLALAACGTTTSSVGSPALYTVSLTLADDANPGSGRVDVTAQLVDRAGKSVEFTGGQKIACNGVYLAWSPIQVNNSEEAGINFSAGGGYSAVVPIQTAGGRYAIDYWDERGQLSSIVIPAASAPQVTAPAAGAAVRIPSSGTLSLSYTNADGVSGVASAVNGSAADSRGVSVAGTDQPDTGSYTLTPGGSGHTFSQLAPGAGTISLIRHFKGMLPAGAFHTVSLDYLVGAVIAITWR